MFENQQPPAPQPPQNPLNPVMPSPGMTPPPTGITPPMPQPAAPRAEVHTMPERFRTAGGSGGGPSTPNSTRRLMRILLLVVALAVLVGGGLFAYQRFVATNTSTTNTNTTETNTTNTNEDETANLNENENVNDNTNVATNDNTNTTVNSNANANTNTSTNTNSTVTTPLPSSTDTDQDGLTDTEEVVYGTDAAKPDTDGDTFIDGKQVRADGSVVGEVVGGYNPNGTGRLEGSTLVKRQENGTKEYSILVPSAWTATNDSTGGILITPNQNTTEFFQLRIHDNASKQSPKQWYQTASPGAQTDNLSTVAVNGLEGIVSEDGSTVYLFKDAKVYSIEYNTGSVTQVNYRTTFEFLYNSFKLVAASS